MKTKDKLPCENCLVLPMCKKRADRLFFIESLKCKKLNNYLKCSTPEFFEEKRIEFKRLMGQDVML